MCQNHTKQSSNGPSSSVRLWRVSVCDCTAVHTPHSPEFIGRFYFKVTEVSLNAETKTTKSIDFCASNAPHTAAEAEMDSICWIGVALFSHKFRSVERERGYDDDWRKIDIFNWKNGKLISNWWIAILFSRSPKETITFRYLSFRQRIDLMQKLRFNLWVRPD